MQTYIAKKLHLTDDLSWEQKKMAVEFARILGFQSVSASFPVVSFEEGMEVPTDWDQLDMYFEENKIQVPEGYVSATDFAKPVKDFDWRAKKGLETLFSKGELLKDRDLDFLPDLMDMKFIMKKDADLSVLAAVCTFAFRFGMEVTAFEGTLLTDKLEKGNAVIFEEAEQCSVRYEVEKEGVRVYISGSGEELIHFSSEFCSKFPYQNGFDTWKDYLQEMIDSMCMKNLDGQFAYAKAYAQKDDLVLASPEISKTNADLKKEFPEILFENHKDGVKVYEKEYDLSWEIDDLYNVVQNEVCPRLKEGDKVTVKAAVSEEKKERTEAVEKITDLIEAEGAEADKVTVLCSYKQGYIWIEEEIIPMIKKCGQIEKVEIGFKPFLKEGETEWNDENGAVPSYNNIGNDPESWYDLPIRYLQELYPVEDLLVKELGIKRENLHFYAYEGKEDFTYEVKAYGSEEQIVCNEKYKAENYEQPYLEQYPNMGKVHPSTGYIHVDINGRRVLEKRIITDVEKVWSIFQKEVLPDCRAYVEEKTGGNVTESAQPFFSKLQIDLALSEPDYRLDSREDLFSTLDGLHEDLYFAGADYFKNYGLEKTGEMLDAPGLILPNIKKKAGKPYMKVTLYEQKSKDPAIQRKEEKISSRLQRKDIQCYIKEISSSEEGKKAVICVEGADEKVLKSYVELLNKGILEISQKFYDINKIEFLSESGCYGANVHQAVMPEKTLSIKEVDLSESELIGYEKYIEIIEQLKHVPGLNVYRTAVSYTGREIYAVEILPHLEGYISRTKRLTQCPSEILNSRHHANEVSSTNSAFMLIKEILTNEEYKNIPDHLNLVIVPMENVDGSAIHYELQKENPYWKLHVARFNAIGKEFYREHFKPDTIHTEAMGLTRLFEVFLPDIIVDNHGVPSHEWEQQFSGYTSPSYKGFWLPRSLLYGYFWTISDEKYKSNYPVNKKLEDVIADEIAKDYRIASLNEEWAGQFEKFAHGWMPKLFPANYYKDMINYWIPFEYDKEHRYPSIRFPWITTVAYTSEVADETAQGEYLNLCASAHVTHDLATLKMMAESTSVYKNKWNISKDNMEVSYIRQRPVIV